jgi:predicted nucleic acid-binding protein
MIILDTNVLSEAMRRAPDVAVQAWLNDQAAETLYLSTVTLAELLFGVRALPVGQRRNALDDGLQGLLVVFKHRVLPFDADPARCYAELAVKARDSGRPKFRSSQVIFGVRSPTALNRINELAGFQRRDWQIAVVSRRSA